MATFEHLVKSNDVGAELDDIASADPPAYLRRALERDRPQDTEAAAELEELAGRLTAG